MTATQPDRPDGDGLPKVTARVHQSNVYGGTRNGTVIKSTADTFTVKWDTRTVACTYTRDDLTSGAPCPITIIEVAIPSSSNGAEGDIARSIETIENAYNFVSDAGPLKNCGEWKYLKRLVSAPPQPAPDAAIRSRLPKYASAWARDLAQEAMRDMEDERHDGGLYALARWFDALSAPAPDTERKALEYQIAKARSLIACGENVTYPSQSAARYVRQNVREEREAIIEILERRASGFAARSSTIYNGKIIADELRSNIRTILSLPSAPVSDEPLADLVSRFSTALLGKLRYARDVKGRSGWEQSHWAQDCQRALLDHIPKGDPLDVAAYTAFCWHHGWSTALSEKCPQCHGEGVLQPDGCGCEKCGGSGKVPPAPVSGRDAVIEVPKIALDWLNGEAPDADGKWFGDDIPQRDMPPRKQYWWRSKFRSMIPALSNHKESGT